MEKPKQSKHKCKCYSEESSSFLYGLRREGPSTQRVVLERQLNVLSRAAVSSNNPQRLWAKSEEPEWWSKCTDLPWKNPREHPKDKKETLKKKIEVLETELRKRGLITPAMDQELATWQSSKKSDLELKSDYEAVIAKASGLHYMMGVVKAKADKSHVISDRIAQYIREIKHCFGECLKIVDKMFERVEKLEQRKQSLWEKMGVSKTELAPSVNENSSVSDIVLSVTSPNDSSGLRTQNDHFAVSPSEVLVSAPPVASLPTMVSSELPDVDSTSHAVRLLHRSVSEPEHPPPVFVDSAPSRRLEKIKSLSVAALTPSVTEPINLTQLHQNVQQHIKPQPHRRQGSKGPSLESLTESPQGDVPRSHHRTSVSFDSSLTAPIHAVDVSAGSSATAAALSLPQDVPGYFRKRLREPEDDEVVETRKNKTQRQPSRPKSWAGRGLLSPASTIGLSSSLSGRVRYVVGGNMHISSPCSVSLSDSTGSSSLTRKARNIAYPFSPTAPSAQVSAGSGEIKFVGNTPEMLEIEDGSSITCEQLNSMEILAVITSDPENDSEGSYFSTPVTGRGPKGLQGLGIGDLEDTGVTGLGHTDVMASEHRYSTGLHGMSITGLEDRSVEDLDGRLDMDIDREVEKISSNMTRTLSCEDVASPDQTFIHDISHTVLFDVPATAADNTAVTGNIVSVPHYHHAGLPGGSPQLARRATNVNPRNSDRRQSSSPAESLSVAIGKYGVF